MKKAGICLLLAIGIMILSHSAFAAGVEETGIESENDKSVSDVSEASVLNANENHTDESESNYLTLDDKNTYEGMEKAYEEGYEPLVKDGWVSVILPIDAAEGHEIKALTAMPDLGDTASAPFIFRNYRKTFQVTNEMINGTGEEKAVFLIRFDLELSKERYNGVYPVEIQIDYHAEGQEMSQVFTIYVQITDGKDKKETEEGNEEEIDKEKQQDEIQSGENIPVNQENVGTPVVPETPKEENPTSDPKVIIDQCIGMPEQMISGSELEFTAVLKNTNRTKYVQNITVAVTCEAEGITLKNSSNIFYFEKLGTESTLEIPLQFHIDEKTAAGKYSIVLDMSYDNPDASPLTSSGKIDLLISQKIDMALEVGKFASEVNAGDSIKIPVQAMNLGRGMIYNVRCSLDVQGLNASKSLFLGNLDGGTAASGELDVFAGMIDEKAESADKRYGKTSGNIILTFEDENGVEQTQSKEIVVTINPLELKTVNTSNDKEERKVIGQQMAIGLGILASLGILGVTVPMVLKKSRKGITMNRREAIKYSLRILRRKNTIISGVFLMFAFYWFYCSCTTGYKLYTEMSESVEIQCSIPENSLEMIKKAEEVSAITEYKECIQEIKYQGYTAQVTLKGMEEEYISHVYAQVLQAPFTESMPCLIVDASVFGSMENEKKEKMKETSWEDMIFQTVFVSGHEARIYGVSQENGEAKTENKLTDQESLYVLTTLEGYEALTAELTEEEGELKTPEIKNYYVEVKDGYRWNKLENKLADWGITVIYGNSGEKSTHKWEEEEEQIRHQLIMCLMSFICGSMLIFYQGCLWKQEYEAFVRYINQIDATGKTFRRVYGGRIVLHMTVGMLGGFFMFAASTSFIK